MDDHKDKLPVDMPEPVGFKDRMVKEVVAPPLNPLTKDQLFSAPGGLPDINIIKEHFLREGRLTFECASHLVSLASRAYQTEPNMLNLTYPLTVCGDVHGQYFDLVRLLEVGGDPASTQYLFLGDYVDRGCFSCEVVFYLFCLKLNYPRTFFMLRGNHECRHMTEFFNFKDECIYKYDIVLYEAVMEAFDHLPISALINHTFFCVHGGLSPDIDSLDDIIDLDRHREIPREGAMCDLLWSDPMKDEMRDAAGDEYAEASWFVHNETRQCSYMYGEEAVKRFLKHNRLTSIIRAHEAQKDGYHMHMTNPASGIPRVITIFSAPNYCDVYSNKGAVLKLDQGMLNIKQYMWSDHPYYLPNFMNVFQWSLPFVAEKVTDMLVAVLDCEDAEPISSMLDHEGVMCPIRHLMQRRSGYVSERGGVLKKKVQAVTAMLRIYKALRQHTEAVCQLKQLTPSHQVPFGLIRAGPDAIRQAISSFESAQSADRVNERRPSQSDLRAKGDARRSMYKVGRDGGVAAGEDVYAAAGAVSPRR